MAEQPAATGTHPDNLGAFFEVAPAAQVGRLCGGKRRWRLEQVDHRAARWEVGLQRADELHADHGDGGGAGRGRSRARAALQRV